MKTVTGRTHVYMFPKDGSTSVESLPTSAHGGLGFRLASDSLTSILRGNSWDGLAPFEPRTGMTLAARIDTHLGVRLVRVLT